METLIPNRKNFYGFAIYVPEKKTFLTKLNTNHLRKKETFSWSKNTNQGILFPTKTKTKRFIKSHILKLEPSAIPCSIHGNGRALAIVPSFT